MANIPFQRGVGPNSLAAVQIILAALQRKSQLDQIAQARQGATSQVQVGATPIDFSRPMGVDGRSNQGGIRSAPFGMPQDSIATNPMQFPMENQLDRAKYLQNLLQIVSGNQEAQKEIGIQSQFLPKPFSASPGQVFGTQDPITMERKIEGQVPMKPSLPTGFAQITDPNEKSRIWNQTYGTNLPASSFEQKPISTDIDLADGFTYRVFFDPMSKSEVGRVKVGPTKASASGQDKAKRFGAISDLVANIEKGYNSKYVGGVGSAIGGQGAGGIVGGVREFTGKITDQEAQFRANVNSLKNQLLYLRSGAQINEQEYQRLLKEMPDVSLPPNVFISRLNAFKKQLQSLDTSDGQPPTIGGKTENIQDRKSVNGKEYVKINGEWYEE